MAWLVVLFRLVALSFVPAIVELYIFFYVRHVFFAATLAFSLMCEMLYVHCFIYKAGRKPTSR
jgi:hypothetical protein